MDIQGLLIQVKAAVREFESRNEGSGSRGVNFDANALIGQIEQLFENYQHIGESPQSTINRLEPHGMDPYGGLPDEAGKPADQGAGL